MSAELLARASDEVAVHASTTCRPVTRPNPATAEAKPSMSPEVFG